MSKRAIVRSQSRSLTTTVCVATILLGAAAASPADAQQRPTVPAAATRTAGIAPAPPVVAAGAASPALPMTVTAGVAPVIVGSDGRVFANFGQGYEQVIRSCAAVRVAAPASPSTSGAPSYLPQPFTPSTYAPPVYTPPGYTPPSYTPPGTRSPPVSHATTASTSAGIAPAPAQPAAVASDAGRAMCWTTNELGRIIVVR